MFNRKFAILMSLICVVTLVGCGDKKKEEKTELTTEAKPVEGEAAKEGNEEDALAKAIENVESAEGGEKSEAKPEEASAPAVLGVPSASEEETKAA